jgi:hypothetical protein
MTKIDMSEPGDILTADGQVYREGMTLYRLVRGEIVEYPDTQLYRGGERGWDHPYHACIKTDDRNQGLMWNLVFRLYTKPANTLVGAIEEAEAKIDHELRQIESIRQEIDRLRQQMSRLAAGEE